MTLGKTQSKTHLQLSTIRLTVVGSEIVSNIEISSRIFLQQAIVRPDPYFNNYIRNR